MNTYPLAVKLCKMNEMKVGNVFLPGLEVLFLVRSGLTSASQPNQSHLLFTQILRTVLEIYPDYSLIHITCGPFYFSRSMMLAKKCRLNDAGILKLTIFDVGDANILR